VNRRPRRDWIVGAGRPQWPPYDYATECAAKSSCATTSDVALRLSTWPGRGSTLWLIKQSGILSGAVEAVGAVAFYAHGPGTVLRCPHCDSVLMKVVTDGERYWVDLRGLRILEPNV
jgi:hypothetical protein